MMDSPPPEDPHLSETVDAHPVEMNYHEDQGSDTESMQNLLL